LLDFNDVKYCITVQQLAWDCGLLGSTHRIVFGDEKSWKQLRSSRGTRHDDDELNYSLSVSESADLVD